MSIYCFRTKGELRAAVADAHEDDSRARAAQFDKQPVPRERLLAFLDSVIESRDSLARYDCAIGSLCQEMNKGETDSRARESATHFACTVGFRTVSIDGPCGCTGTGRMADRIGTGRDADGKRVA